MGLCLTKTEEVDIELPNGLVPVLKNSEESVINFCQRICISIQQQYKSVISITTISLDDKVRRYGVPLQTYVVVYLAQDRPTYRRDKIILLLHYPETVIFECKTSPELI